MSAVRSVIFLAWFLHYYAFSVIALEVKPDFYEQNKEACERLAKNPYFDKKIVMSKTWRVYYVWNLELDEKCLDVVFKNATRSIMRRVRSRMNKYLDRQPDWKAATLLMKIGPTKHELLLVANQGPDGSFTGVPNVRGNTNYTPKKGAVPLLQLQMKLLQSGTYLLMMDCRVGGSSLSASATSPPMDVLAEAAALNLGDGFSTCMS